MNKTAKSGQVAIALLTVVVFAVCVFFPCGTSYVYAAAKNEAPVNTPAEKNVMVNVNKASTEELQTVRGIGPAIAGRIIQYRSEHGLFSRIEDLTSVRGISNAKFQKIKNQVTI